MNAFNIMNTNPFLFCYQYDDIKNKNLQNNFEDSYTTYEYVIGA